MPVETNWMSVYRDAPELTKLVVDVLAVVHRPLSRHDVNEYCSQWSQACGGKGLAPRVIRSALDQAQALRLVVGGAYKFGITEGAKELLRRQVHSRGDYVPLCDVIEALESVWEVHTDEARTRSARRAVYEGRADEFQRYREACDYPPRIAEWFVQPLDIEVLKELPPALAGVVFRSVVSSPLTDKERALVDRALDDTFSASPSPELAAAVGYRRLQDGRFDLPSAGLEDPTGFGSMVEGAGALLRGDIKAACKHYASGLAQRRSDGCRFPALGAGFVGWLLPLAYWLSGTKGRRSQANRLMRVEGEDFRFDNSDVVHSLEALRRCFDGNQFASREYIDPVAVLFVTLAQKWTGTTLDTAAIDGALANAEQRPHWWARQLRAAATDDHTLVHAPAVALHTQRATRHAWESKLEKLDAMLASKAPAADSGRKKRIAWLLRWDAEGWLDLEARVQLRRKSGWSAGRKIANSKIVNIAAMEEATPADIQLAGCQSVKRHTGWSGYTEYEFDWKREAAWLALVGHPAVVDPQSHEPITVSLTRPTLTIARHKKHLELRVNAPETLLVQDLGSGRLAVTVLNKQERALAEVLQGLRVPERAKERLGPIIARVAGVFEVDDRAGAGAADDVAADPQCVVQLRPSGSGLAAAAVVRPLGAGGPSLVPGEGPKRVMHVVEGSAKRTRRDLSEERRHLMALQREPALMDIVAEPEGVTYDSLEEALDVVLALQSLEVTVEWPEGKALRVSAADTAKMKVNITGESDWFSASGRLQVSESTVLQLADLVARVGASRFVALDSGEFLALSEDLRRRLAVLRRVAEVKQGKLQLHRFASGALQSLVERSPGRRSKSWKAWVDQSEVAVERAPVPRPMQADLRPYQVQGYQWLIERAALGAGACLADDMGLGKTVQTLAVLLQRMSDGPALVVAPTSVCGGWMTEAWRFAPALTTHRFGVGSRTRMLESLGPGDVVVASYGLLQSESDRLSQVQWSTLVLDEAQAIKNPSTKRHKAAVALQARFRVALTGTPIENHLGELWAQFSVLNPGMLGSLERFRDRLATPAENGDADAARALRQLISPFVLRRTKTAVLEDLPSKTDITVTVELSSEESAFYEGLRRRAVESLEDASTPMAVLAELTRLRQAACNARLVTDASDAPASSKLAAFADIVARLREGGHRALVFSQFVSHLGLIREWLDQANIPYEYLDGSTPAFQRDERVRRFQSGIGDLFLISLKAGGTGLNLTSADYVVHMDPWWNPAVEDQASDRAHRIGQTRPVTVYRLVAKGTVEEQIVELHHKKRDLADRLLAGTNMARRLDISALMDLLQNSGLN